MSTFTFGDMQVSAASGGRELDPEQPLVLLVHGAGMDRTVWSLQTRWLAHHGMSVLAIDLPGHGSSPDPERTSIDDYADWLASLVEAAARPVHLVGHSMGTFIVLETAVRTSVASLTLVGTASSMPVHPKLIEAAEANDPLASQLMSGWAFAHRSRGAAHPSPGAAMIGGAQALIQQSKPGVLHRDLAMCAAYEAAPTTASSVSAPTTFLLGTADRMTPVPNAASVIDAIPHARVEKLAGVGHMIQIEAPDDCRRVIAETVAAG